MAEMTRYQFLKSIGFSGAALMAVLASCTKSEDSITAATTIDTNDTSGGGSTTTATDGVNATVAQVAAVTSYLLKTTLASSAGLKTAGGFIVSNGIVLARVSGTAWAAVPQTCSHEPKKKVVYQKATNKFYCSEHGALFTTAGVGLNSFGAAGLKSFKVLCDGTNVVVYA